jgi:lipopolysaccharide transport system ATP-binding protein
MSEDYLLRVQDVSKKFCRDFKKSLFYGLKDIGRELMGRPNGKLSLRLDEFWAVRNVSFELKPGESIAILGRNGAGKSTLLRMITGRIRMDEGEIRLRGKVAAINELGAGFSPIQTGRENIYNSGSIYGLNKEQIDAIFEQIVDFSEVREFIDSPVANYSSGMKARLGYAITSFLEPDLFIMDEVLSVGDILFRKKCMAHLQKYRESGRSIIMATHDLFRIQLICTHSIVIDKGQIAFHGSVLDGINYFLDMLGMTRSDLFSQDALLKVKTQVRERDVALKEGRFDKGRL